MHNNKVGFEGIAGIGKDAITVGWSMDRCFVTYGQPFGQDDYSPSSGEAVVPDGSRLQVHAGRKNNADNAVKFAEGLGAANLLGIGQGEVSKPDRLNFAIVGTLTLTVGSQTWTFPDFRVGQGHKGLSNNWWIGSADCQNRGGNVVRCQSVEGTYLQFQGKSRSKSVFQVSHA